MSDIQQKKMNPCPQDRPICLNKPIKPIKKHIEENCTKIKEEEEKEEKKEKKEKTKYDPNDPNDTNKYDPNERINDIITCQTKTCSPDSYNESNNTENCYSLTTAWLVIMGDLEKKIEDFVKIIYSNVKSISEEERKNIDKIRTVKDVIDELMKISKYINGIKLKKIFGSIKKYGMEKWGIHDDQIEETSDKIDIVILFKFDKLINSPGFIKVSDSLRAPSGLVEKILDEYSNNNDQKKEEIMTQDKMFETIQNLFKTTKYFMVEKRELINYKKDDIIKLFDSVITNLNKMFENIVIPNNPTGGGVETPIRALNKDKRSKLYTSLGKQIINSSLRGTIDVLLLSFGSSIGLSSLISVAAVVSAAIPFFNIAVAVVGVGLIIGGAVKEYKKYVNSVTILEREINELINKYNNLPTEDKKIEDKKIKYKNNIEKFYEKYKDSYLNETKSLIKEIIKLKLSDYKEEEEVVKRIIEEEEVKRIIEEEKEKEEEEKVEEPNKIILNDTSLYNKIKDLPKELNKELKEAKKNAEQAANDIINKNNKKNGQQTNDIQTQENQDDREKNEKSIIYQLEDLKKNNTNDEELNKIINLYKLQKFIIELNDIKSKIKIYTSKKYKTNEKDLKKIDDFFNKNKEFIPPEILKKYNQLYSEPNINNETKIYEWNLVNPDIKTISIDVEPDSTVGGSNKVYKYKKRQCITRKKNNQQKITFNKSKKTHIKKRYIKGHKFRTYYTKKNKKVCIKRTKKRKNTIYV